MAAKIRKSLPHLEEIFTLRPYTRIISWGRQLKNTLRYQVINKMESLGLIKRDSKKAKKMKKQGRMQLNSSSGASKSQRLQVKL